MATHLFIDDIRDIPANVIKTPDQWAIARNANSAREMIMANDFEIVSFDNDLGIEDPRQEGQAVLKDLLDLCRDGNKPYPKEIWVHTSNPPARRNMEARLEFHGYKKYYSATLSNTMFSFWEKV
jgi:hypothetical protein